MDKSTKLACSGSAKIASVFSSTDRLIGTAGLGTKEAHDSVR